MSVAEERSATLEPLRPDIAQISSHLYALFSPAFAQAYTEAWIEIAFCRPDEELNRAKHFSAFTLNLAAEFAEKKNKAGFNIYVGAALRHGEAGESGRASGANVLAASHSWAEFDQPGDDARIDAILKEKDLATAMTIVTGRTPNVRRTSISSSTAAVPPIS
jgi:hypothetical protein